jgi:hypothetical protein
MWILLSCNVMQRAFKECDTNRGKEHERQHEALTEKHKTHGKLTHVRTSDAIALSDSPPGTGFWCPNMKKDDMLFFFFRSFEILWRVAVKMRGSAVHTRKPHNET